jgi:hypothetical protein
MAVFSWIGQELALTSAALTVRVQTLSPNDNGALIYDAFFPRRDVDSVKLRYISNLDYRPVADRREWDARGRYVPLQLPKLSDIELVPVESYFKLGEREIQELSERTFGNMEEFRRIVSADIPARTDLLANSNYRRLEVDAFTAWANGNIVARNPLTNTTQTVSFGFASNRYTTATPWTGGAGGNAYANFVAWLRTSIDLVGPIQGAMMRLSTFLAIQANAPNPMSYNASIPATRGVVEDRIRQELGTDFQFYINEKTADVFTNAGLTVARTKLWPANKVAVVPAGEVVGDMAFAPVARAMELARNSSGESGIDVRGMTVYNDADENAGRQLTVECQVNAIPIPIEARLSVIDAGI